MRPTRRVARAAIDAFLRDVGLEYTRCDDECSGCKTSFDLIEDGQAGWAFWILADDTTSYVHHDLSIEWLGTHACPVDGES